MEDEKLHYLIVDDLDDLKTFDSENCYSISGCQSNGGCGNSRTSSAGYGC